MFGKNQVKEEMSLEKMKKDEKSDVGSLKD